MLKVLKKSKKQRHAQKHNMELEKVQKEHDCFLSENEDKKRRKRLSCFILGLAVLLIIGPSFFFLKHRFPATSLLTQQAAAQKDQEIMTLASLIYRHFNGYDAYCIKQGYRMNSYPKLFAKRFQNEMIILDQKAKEQGSSLEGVLNQIKQQFGPVFDRIIETELKTLRQQEAAKNPEVASKIQHISSADICRWIDENTTLILSDPENEDFIRIRQLANGLTSSKK